MNSTDSTYLKANEICLKINITVTDISNIE